MESLKQLISMRLPTAGLFAWMPTAASQQAQQVDSIFYFLLISCTALFALVVVPMTVFVLRYRRRTATQKALSQIDHNFTMEVVWTLLPIVYLAGVFTWGFWQFLDMRVAPSEAMNLRVVGQKWQWTALYPNDGVEIGGQGSTIGVPVNQPVKIILSSQDVIHSFFVPNLRVKQDAVPGRYTTLWFNPNKIGEYPILCAEYCGQQHSQMVAMLKVMSKQDYTAWLQKTQEADQGLSLEDLGKKLYVQKGCNACHTTDGSRKIGPSFKGAYGSTEQLEGGGSVVVNDDYIRQSILTPQKQITKGYPPVMPSYQGQVKEKDLAALIAFIKSLK
ncbi:MAG: cytochrome c oxidase subunit II [Myxococcota bacterium]